MTYFATCYCVFIFEFNEQKKLNLFSSIQIWQVKSYWNWRNVLFAVVRNLQYFFPINIYLFKVTIEALEKGVKYVQS